MPDRPRVTRRIARLLLGAWVGTAVLLLVEDVRVYVHFSRLAGGSAWVIDQSPPSRRCAYDLQDQRRQPAGARYFQVWKVVCTFDHDKAYRPDDYPAYYDLLVTDVPARFTTANYLPLGALAARALGPIAASWQDGALHVATWSGGLMDIVRRSADVRVVVDGKGRT